MLGYDYGLNEAQALGLLQHYGLPTRFIDFSWQAGIATAFAAAGDAGIGRICVMPVGLGTHHPLIADLSAHPWAHRAQAQHAVGVVAPVGFEDLKSPEARKRFDLTWIEFQISEPERKFFLVKHKELVSLADDPSSGFLRHHLIEYVEAKGKLSPDLTEWLLARIPMAPRCYRGRDFESSDVIVTNAPPSEFGAFDQKIEMDRTRRYLSTAYLDSSWDRMQGWTWPCPGTLVADPRTLHAR
jgi:hypothetical protein